MPEQQQVPFRLAIRSEGNMVSAYLAYSDSMADATLLGSIRRGLVKEHPALFDEWRLLMQSALGQVVEDALGVKPVWPREPVPAPEHERSGRA